MNKVKKTATKPLRGIDLLISEINLFLDNHTTIHGFTRVRLEELLYNRFLTVHNYEWRLLLKWKGIYVFQFEAIYRVSICIE